ncbi:MAG: hypothetical protein LBG84_09290 [Treponema sp.]|nr:hypothetical protein [Treponema sp.]
MDEVFDNIFYFIPVAFIIAVRLIGSRNSKERQKKPPAPPPAAAPRPAPVPHWEEARGPEVKPAAEKRPVPKSPPVKLAAKARGSAPQKRGSGPLSSRTVLTSNLDAESLSPPGAGFAPQAAVETVPASARTIDPDSLLSPGLSPLQRVFMWTEILGPPRADVPFTALDNARG